MIIIDDVDHHSATPNPPFVYGEKKAKSCVILWPDVIGSAATTPRAQEDGETRPTAELETREVKQKEGEGQGDRRSKGGSHWRYQLADHLETWLGTIIRPQTQRDLLPVA